MIISKPALSLPFLAVSLALIFASNAFAAVNPVGESSLEQITASFKNPDLTLEQAQALVYQLEPHAGLSEEGWNDEWMAWTHQVAHWPDPTLNPKIQALVAQAHSVEDPVVLVNDCSNTQVVNSGQIAILRQNIVCTVLPVNDAPAFLVNEGGQLYLNGFTIRTDDGSGGYLGQGTGIMLAGDNAVLFGGGFRPDVGKIKGFEVGVSAQTSSAGQIAFPVIELIASNHNSEFGFDFNTTEGVFEYLQANHNGFNGIKSYSELSAWAYVQANNNGTTENCNNPSDICGAGVYALKSIESSWLYVQANRNVVAGIYTVASQINVWEYIQANHNGELGILNSGTLEGWAYVQANHNEVWGILAFNTTNVWEYIQTNHNGETIDVTDPVGGGVTLFAIGFELAGNNNTVSHLQSSHNGGHGVVRTTIPLLEILTFTFGVNVDGDGNNVESVYAHHNGDHLKIQGTASADPLMNLLNYENIGVLLQGSGNAGNKIYAWHNGNHFDATHMRIGSKSFNGTTIINGFALDIGIQVTPFVNDVLNAENTLTKTIVVGNGSRGHFKDIPASTPIARFNDTGILIEDGKTTVSHSLALFNGEQGGHEINGCATLDTTHLTFGCTSAGIQMVNGRLLESFSGYNGIESKLPHSLTAGIINDIAVIPTKENAASTKENAASTFVPEIKESWSTHNRSPKAHHVKGYGVVSVSDIENSTGATLIERNTLADNDIGLDYLGFGSSSLDETEQSVTLGIYENTVFENHQDGMIIRGNNNKVAENLVEYNGDSGIVVTNYDMTMISKGNLIERNTSLFNHKYNIVDTAEPSNCSADYNTWKNNLIANKDHPSCLQ